jgi:sterol desaturase/sphingolipid hydroxylase (fatty acid hydroxylase superfamily)
MKIIITYGLYPFLLVLGLGVCALAILLDWDVSRTYTYMAIGRFVLLFGLEFIFPINPEWKMTWPSFFRDVKYFIAIGLTGFLFKYAIGLIAIKNAHFEGILTSLPLVLAALVALLIYEFLQYWFHRISHEAKGKFGLFLWKVHSIHHLPDKVYLLMHPVSHPVNAIVVLMISQAVFVGLGVDAQTLLLINTIISLQGLISHFNVEIKAGWLNYIFIGTELHRFHHSANVNEAKNFGAVLAIWDIVFGTFYYQKNRIPEELGVFEPEKYPDSTEIFKTLRFPFKKQVNS